MMMIMVVVVRVQRFRVLSVSRIGVEADRTPPRAYVMYAGVCLQLATRAQVEAASHLRSVSGAVFHTAF